MNIGACRHLDNTTRNLIKDWLFTLNLFFILYSLVMLATFLLGPQSGRLSTLVCKPDTGGKSVCTVKIYGVHKMYRKDFYADDYMYTLRSSTFESSEYRRSHLSDLSLPWSDAYQASTSDEIVCAVSIRIQSQLVDFIPPYQRGSVCTRAAIQVEAAFAGDRSVINIRINGYNPQTYWRIALLVIASLLFLAQFSARLRSRRRNKNAVAVADGQKEPSAPGTANIPTDLNLKPAKEEAHPVGLGRKRFILFWWAASVVVIAFLVISTLLNSLVRTGFWLSGCFLNIHDYQKLYLFHPFTNLIDILPIIILITFWMVLQWQVLSTEVLVSRWWIASPLLAGIPLLVGLPPTQSCSDIFDIAIPTFFPASNPQVATGLSVVVYFLVFGFIQWLVMRRKIKISIGWIVILFLSVCGEIFLPFFLFFLGLSYATFLLRNELILPAIICLVPTVLLLGTIFNFVPGFYLYWAIRKKETSLVQPVSD